MSCIRNAILTALILLNFNAVARSSSPLVYDLGVSTGTYEQQNYTEIHLGFSWRFLAPLAWRNTTFLRLGETSSSAGLDSSIRYLHEIDIDSSGLGLSSYLGPGYRFSKKELSGPFVEGGVMLKSTGFGLGLGAKSIFYHSPNRYENGNEAAKNETVILIILGIGGGF